MNREEWRKKSRDQRSARAEQAAAEYRNRLTENPNYFLPHANRPNILTPDRQRYMEQCVRLARAAGLPASGNNQFELSIPCQLSGLLHYSLETLFQDANSGSAVKDFIKQLVEQLSTQRLLAEEFCENRLSFITLPGDQAINEWQRRSAIRSETGVLPVILSADLSKDNVRTRVSSAAVAFADDIASAQHVEVSDWFDRQRTAYAADGWLDETVVGHPNLSNPNKGELSTHFTLSGRQVRKRVTLAMLRADFPWHSALMLQSGGWNDSPDAIHQAAVLSYWERKYGARIAGFGSDSIECFVERPPMDLSAAMQLAWEHFLFCADTVQQGTGTIGALSEILLESHYWHFWWD